VVSARGIGGGTAPSTAGDAPDTGDSVVSADDPVWLDGANGSLTADRCGIGTLTAAACSFDGLLDGRTCSQPAAHAAGTGAGSASTPNVGTLTATVCADRWFSSGAQVVGADDCTASAVTTRLASRSRRSRCRSAWTSRAD
jgi:hypothetical protein